VEAKGVKHNQDRITSAASLVEHTRKELKLLGRISAFTKEEDGGSYFLGVGEEHVKRADSSGVLKDTDERTGSFLCEGVVLTDEPPQEKLQEALEKTVKEKMWWYPGYPDSVVKVIMHPVSTTTAEQCDRRNGVASSVRNGEDSSVQAAGASVRNDKTARSSSKHASFTSAACETSSPTGGLNVVEIFVQNFTGVCFTDPSGPEAYRYRSPENPEKDNKENDDDVGLQTAIRRPVRISKDEWLEEQLKAVKTFSL
jgi:hypothetical protein